MSDIFKLIWRAVVDLFRSRASLEAEILTLRHQLNVLRRNSPKRPAFTNIDRLVFAALYRLVPRHQPIEGSKNQAIAICESWPLWRIARQHIELMAQRQDLRLKRSP